MNIFENRKASSFFAEICDVLNSDKRKRFSREIKSLFNLKSVSESGEYQSYKITEDDVLNVARTIK